MVADRVDARRRTVTSATVEPTERSIPPAIMMIVMPSAAVPTITVCTAIVRQLYSASGTTPIAGQDGEQHGDQDQAQERPEDRPDPAERPPEPGTAPLRPTSSTPTLTTDPSASPAPFADPGRSAHFFSVWTMSTVLALAVGEVDRPGVAVLVGDQPGMGEEGRLLVGLALFEGRVERARRRRGPASRP